MRLRIAPLAFLLSVAAFPAVAQQPYLSMAPVRWQAGVTADAEGTTMLAGVDRSVPLHFFLPNVGRTSRVDVAAVAVGARTTADETRFRFRATALDLTISRNPWNGGVRLLSYDRTGTRDVVADWALVQAGTAVMLGTATQGVEARIEMRGALSTRRIGGTFFPRLAALDRGSDTGFAASITAAVTSAASETLYLDVRVGEERLWAGVDPTWRFAEASLHVGFATRFEAVATLGLGRAGIGESVEENPHAGLALRFTPAAQRY